MREIKNFTQIRANKIYVINTYNNYLEAYIPFKENFYKKVGIYSNESMRLECRTIDKVMEYLDYKFALENSANVLYEFDTEEEYEEELDKIKMMIELQK